MQQRAQSKEQLKHLTFISHPSRGNFMDQNKKPLRNEDKRRNLKRKSKKRNKRNMSNLRWRWLKSRERRKREGLKKLDKKRF